jgi:hypothetical protein
MIGFIVPITSMGLAPRRARSSSAVLPDLLERVAAGFGEHLRAAVDVVAADGEGQEVESVVDVTDSCLFLVQGKTWRSTPTSS